MLIPTGWLGELTPLPDDMNALAERLTMTGNEIEELREHSTGPVLFLKLTPNRADMLAMYGVAREVAALYDQPEPVPQPAAAQSYGPPSPEVSVTLEAPELCPRYAARVVRGVRPGDSPGWLVQRLDAAGLRSVNNIVDVTNYVMLELGQPLHAFDLDRLAGSAIIVRRAVDGETITTLDGTEAPCDPQTLLICDAAGPVAIAGVMGGLDSEISADTENILIESAYFDPVSVRRTARRTGIATAASYRFERGIDPAGVRTALDRCALLVTELAGGAISETVYDLYPEPIEPRIIPFRPDRCRRLIGAPVTDEQCAGIFRRLGLSVASAGALWQIAIPTRRVDLQIEEDLIEEVARLHGYDRLPATLPAAATGPGSLSREEETRRRIRRLLTAHGLNEALTHTLTSRSRTAQLDLAPSPAHGSEPDKTLLVPLRNPAGDEWDVLRGSLLPGLLEAASYNFRRGSKDIFLFETGTCYWRSIEEESPVGRTMVAGLLLGSRWSECWNPPSGAAADFFTARGVVEALCREFGLAGTAIAAATHPAFHPGRSAELLAGARRVGFLGELHPRLERLLDLPRELYLFELDAAILNTAGNPSGAYSSPPRFPAALRDLAVVLTKDVPASAAEAVIREEIGDLCRSVRLFDVFTGPALGDDSVSLAFAVELGARDRTLTDEEVETKLASARKRLQEELGATFRE